MKVIGVSGKMHSGKTYVTDRLIDRDLGRRLSFAGPLKRDILNMGFTQKDIDEKPPWMRKLMQVYGQAKRAVDPDHWVNQLMLDIAEKYRTEQLPTLFGSAERVIFIDDIRFENEADAIINLRDQGIASRLIRMERKDYDRDDIIGSDDLSEMALDYYPDFDMTYHVPSGDLQGLVSVATSLEDWLNG